MEVAAKRGELTTDAERIYGLAYAHGGSFLLPMMDWRNKTEDWQFCRDLVESGHARWMGSYDLYHPGIRLTGKPFEHASGAPAQSAAISHD